MFTTETPMAQLFSIAEQRRDAAEAGAVADAGRHRDRPARSTRPATTLGSAPSMPATTMMTRAAFRRACSPSSRWSAGDADVVEPVDRVAHQLGGDRRFFGDRQVGGAGGGDEDGAAARRDVAAAQA